MNNKNYRMRELIPPSRGRSLVVDASNGLSLGALPGLEDFSQALAPILSRVGGVVASPGQARWLVNRTREDAALLVCGDWTNAIRKEGFILPPEQIHYVPLLEPADALDLGASALVMHFLLGHEEHIEALCMKRVVALGLSGAAVGLPLIVDVLPIGPRVVLLSKAIELGASYAIEGGADGLVIPWPGVDSFFNIKTMAGELPVWVKPDSLEPGEPELAESLNLGAAGFWLDERLFAAGDPAVVVQALNARLHAQLEV